MHLQPVFRPFPAYLNGTSEHLFNIGLCLPSSSSLTREEFDRVVNVIGERV
jgi:dTDP-4-amino-4,6-dideoxygalactose transaminase